MRSLPNASKVLLPTFEEMMVPGAEFVTESLEWDLENGEDLVDREMIEDTYTRNLMEGPDPEAILAETESLCGEMIHRAEEEARNILENARKEAEAIVRETREQEQVRARAELEKELERLRTSILAAAQTLQNAQDGLYAALEPRFLDTAVHMAENILKYELEQNNRAFLSIVQNVLNQSFPRRGVVLYLPSARFDELTGGAGNASFLAGMSRRSVEVRRDPELDEWDCLITSDMGSVRGGTTTQLSRIRSMMGGGQSGGNGI